MAMRASSDLHLSQPTAGAVFRALDVLKAHAQEHGGPTVITGDLFDQPKSVDMRLYNRLRDVLASFPDEVIIVPGNHDQYKGWRNACEALAQPGITVYSEPTMVPGLGLVVPYTEPAEWRRIVAQWSRFPDATPPIVWAHQGFRGSYLNSMVRDRTGLVATDLLGDIVVTGHYHMPQTCGPVIYCGSPYQTTHAEEAQAKGFLFWKDETLQLLPIRLAYGRIAPNYWTADWKPGSPPDIPAGWVEGDIVRVRTEATRSVAKQAAAELKGVGLEGAAIVAQPDAANRPGLLDRGLRPQDAVRQHIQRTCGPEINRPVPSEVLDWGEERGLWRG